MKKKIQNERVISSEARARNPGNEVSVCHAELVSASIVYIFPPNNHQNYFDLQHTSLHSL